MTKHASEYWTTELESTPLGEVYSLRHYVILDGYGNVIAHLPEERKKLAPLIAAAPTMLEALKAVQIAATSPMLLDEENQDMTIDAALALVDAAVTKAGDAK